MFLNVIFYYGFPYKQTILTSTFSNFVFCQEVYDHLAEGLSKLAASHGQQLLNTKHNPISLGSIDNSCPSSCLHHTQCDVPQVRICMPLSFLPLVRFRLSFIYLSVHLTCIILSVTFIYLCVFFCLSVCLYICMFLDWYDFYLSICLPLTDCTFLCLPFCLFIPVCNTTFTAFQPCR